MDDKPTEKEQQLIYSLLNTDVKGVPNH